MENRYRIAYRVGGSSFEIESSDLGWLEKKEQEYLGKMQMQTQSTTLDLTKQQDVALPQTLTINEFYKNYIRPNEITARADIAVFFVYFLQKIQKKEGLKTGDIGQCFADVSYPNYNRLNIADILNQGKRKALLNNVNNLWSLTITGEDFVLNFLTSESK